MPRLRHRARGAPRRSQRFKLPESLASGWSSAPVMFEAEWRDGRWGRGRAAALWARSSCLPGARALQYGEFVFEGMKAYRVGPSLAQSFPPAMRIASACSARRHGCPCPPCPRRFSSRASSAVAGAVAPSCRAQSGRSLYLRPFLFGTESGYMLRNSRTFRFMVIANPVEVYASGPMRVVDRASRCARGRRRRWRRRKPRRIMPPHCAPPMPRWSAAVRWPCGSTHTNNGTFRSFRA